jgi:hypothetical protein
METEQYGLHQGNLVRFERRAGEYYPSCLPAQKKELRSGDILFLGSTPGTGCPALKIQAPGKEAWCSVSGGDKGLLRAASLGLLEVLSSRHYGSTAHCGAIEYRCTAWETLVRFL